MVYHTHLAVTWMAQTGVRVFITSLPWGKMLDDHQVHIIDCSPSWYSKSLEVTPFVSLKLCSGQHVLFLSPFCGVW